MTILSTPTFNAAWAVGCVLFGVMINRIDYHYFVRPPSPAMMEPIRTEDVVFRSLSDWDETHPDSNIRGGKASSASPGDMGIGVEIVRLDYKNHAKRTKMFETHAFDEFVSELISLERSLPDWRDPWCRTRYDSTQDLPPTSIIICFHNEAWSTLLRSLHSVVNRSPGHLIKDIVLVDDASTLEHLGTRLDHYLKEHFEPDLVRLVRLRERHGLMRSRMRGISYASAGVLTFLDSHIEATEGWLEPLLHRIKENPTIIPSPVIDAINDTSLHYTFIQKQLFGLFNWKMEFEWHELPPEEVDAKENPWAPHDNPVMAGGLFSIDRSWFEHLGYYDQGMDVWGGENFELSFKAWMCGGSIEIVPCSRVGHIYRSWSPYKVESQDIKKNNIRVAQVWMDEFQYLYYDRLGHYERNGTDRIPDFGDVSARIQVRKELKCHDFQWYMDNVATALPYHDLIGAGEIRNKEHDLCLDKNDKIEFMNEPIDVLPCHNYGGNQYWWMSANDYLMRDYLCIGALEDNITVAVTHCGHSHPWFYDRETQQFHYLLTGTCLTIQSRQDSDTPNLLAALAPCNEEDSLQKWNFTKFNASSGLRYRDLFYLS